MAASPSELQEQVQISTGGLVVLGVLLSLVSSRFLALSMLVRAELIFGISGTCSMARLLRRAPRNSGFQQG